MEPDYQTVPQMYERFLLMIRQRNDTGFSLAVADNTLEPKNPFEPEARRKPKTGIALGGGLGLVLGAIFVYFSFH
jgi:uncharacterized protein involved in exopolysaccharide biosynthesis